MSFFARKGLAADAADLADALFKDRAEGVALLDRDGTVLRVNPRLTAMLLLSPSHTLWAALPAEVAPALEAALRAGRTALLTSTLDIEARHLVLRFALLPVRHGFGLLRVADQTELQARLDKQGQAQRLQAVGSLAGGIAHDFNNLLTAMLGSVDDLETRLTAEADREELRQVRESAARGAGLVRQLLAFSRQQTLQPKVISLNQAVRHAASLLRRLIAPQVSVSLELEEPERLVRIDPTQLDQVLVNLAVNASHAMPDGGRLTIASRPCVVIRPRRIGSDWVTPGRYAMLSVADTGCGIPAELLPRIFDPFFTTKRERGGTGLGLATVYGIVHQSGGFMGVESAQGDGTAFEILLPRYEESWLGAGAGAAADAVALQPERVGGTASGVGGALRIEAGSCDARGAAVADGGGAMAAVRGTVLLVDDEAAVRRVSERALVREGFTVMTAGSAEEALEKLSEAEPIRLCGVVSDVVMPGMDGTALVRRLRESLPGLPACLMSGYADEDLRDALAANDVVFLGKPFAVKELVRTVWGMTGGERAA